MARDAAKQREYACGHQAPAYISAIIRENCTGTCHARPASQNHRSGRADRPCPSEGRRSRALARFLPRCAGLRGRPQRPGAVFMSAGGYHHHLAINTWESRGGQPPAPGTTGLYHTAILYPTRRLLADALRRVIEAKIPLDGASDHGVSEALYLRDPDRKRRGALSGPSARAMAARRRWRHRHEDGAARSARSAGRAGEGAGLSAQSGEVGFAARLRANQKERYRFTASATARRASTPIRCAR